MKPLIRRTDRFTRLLVAFLALFGLLLLVLSIIVPEVGYAAYLRTFLKELGIVVLAVFSISLVYELWLAEKHEERFLVRLRDQIEKGETNAAACALLGIREIFPTRDRFEFSYNMRVLVEELSQGGKLRVVGRSLFLLMTRPEIVKTAISKGATVELCVFDPRAPQEDIRRSPDLERADIVAALSVFEREVEIWTRDDSPSGSVTVKCHRIPLLDSFVFLSAPARTIAAWEFSFGRHPDSKRVIILESGKSLFEDVWRRYEGVWRDSEIVFQYEGGKIVRDELGLVLDSAAPNSSAVPDGGRRR